MSWEGLMGMSRRKVEEYGETYLVGGKISHNKILSKALLESLGLKI